MCVVAAIVAIFFCGGHLVILQKFVENPLVVSDLVYLDDASKGDDGRSGEEGTLEIARQAV